MPNPELCPCLFATPQFQDLQGSLGLRRVVCNQGALGHANVKPTELGTNLPLQWLTVATAGVPVQGEGGASELGYAGSAWAPGLIDAVADAIDTFCEQYPPPVLAQLTDADRMKQHISQEHKPYWKRCRSCVEGRSRDRPHRRSPVPDVNVLSLDLVGLFRKGRTEQLARVKHMLHAVFVLPDLAAIKRDPSAGAGDGKDSGDSNRVRLEGDHEEPHGLDDFGCDWSPDFEDLFPDDDMLDAPPTTVAAVRPMPDKTPLDDEGRYLLEKLPVVELTFSEALGSKNCGEVLTAVRKVEARIRALGYTVQRIHSDKGLEFSNTLFNAWAAERGILVSSTSGDDYKANGRVEASIGRMKQMVTTQLLATETDEVLWPLAWRHSAEASLRESLKRLGYATAPMIPFGCRVYVKKRSWKSQQWSAKVVPATVLAPAVNAPNTWLIRTDADEFYSTSVIFRDVLTCPNPPAEVPKTVVHDAMPPMHVRDGSPYRLPPTHRLRAKTRVAVLRNLFMSEDEHAAILASREPFDLDRVFRFLRNSAWIQSEDIGAMKSTRNILHSVWGFFKHGGVVGVTRSVDVLPGFATLLTRTLRQCAPDFRYTTVALVKDGNVPPHRDIHNVPQANLVLPVCVPKDGMYMWSELVQGDPVRGPIELRSVPNGNQVAGHLQWLEPGCPLYLDAKRWHAAQAFSKSRVLLIIAYSLQVFDKATPDMCQHLYEVGFPKLLAPPGESPAFVSPKRESAGEVLQRHADDAHQGGGVSHEKVFSEVFHIREGKNKTKNEKIQNQNKNELFSGGDGKNPPLDAAGSEALRKVSAAQCCMCMDRACGECAQYFSEAPEGTLDSCVGVQSQHRGSPSSNGGLSGEVSEKLAQSIAGSLVEGSPCVVDVEGLSWEEAGDSERLFVRVFRVPAESACLHTGEDVHGGESLLVASELPFVFGVNEWSLLGAAVQETDGHQHALKQVIKRDDRLLKKGLEDGQSLEGVEGAELLACWSSEVQLVENALLQLRACCVDEGSEDHQKTLTEVPQFLQTRTFSNEEVLANWSEPWETCTVGELASLLDTKRALSRTDDAQIAGWRAEGIEVTVVPSKTVYSRKAVTGRHKCRIVICGNALPNLGESNLERKMATYAGGVDVGLLRLLLAEAVHCGYALATWDVATAFLNVPARPRDLRAAARGKAQIVVAMPPKSLVRKGLVPPGERWKVDLAVYGLDTSPRDWTLHRNEVLVDLTVVVLDVVLRLKACLSDSSVWLVVELPNPTTPISEGRLVGWVAIYVDDFLGAARWEYLEALYKQVVSVWQCGALERVPRKGEGQAVRFDGFELLWDSQGKGLYVNQASYIKDMLERHEGFKPQSVPLARALPQEGDPEPDEAHLKLCQKASGELLWLAVRTRPDLAYSCSRIASIMSRRPKEAYLGALGVIGYLSQTAELGLYFSANPRPCQDEAQHGSVGCGLLEVHT
ncbi:RE1, partial [Symbiodinium necroappetens]